LSNDNDVRKQAEAQLESALQTPEPTLLELSAVIRGNPTPKVREMAAVLLRRCAFDDLDERKTRWAKLSPAASTQIRAVLLAALQDEAVEGVSSRICDAVAQTARAMGGTPLG
jgi:hypothetical protein